MTENEVLKIFENEVIILDCWIEQCKDIIADCETEEDEFDDDKERAELSLKDYTERKEAFDVAISALKEIQMYKDGKLLLVPEDVYSRQCSELDAYKEIGTVEECRKAVEKQVKMSEIKLKCQVCGTEFEPKKENRYTGIGFGMFVNTLYDCYDCPKCGSQYRVKERIKEAKCNE